MGRRPCCAKQGMNRGPWSSHEDQALANYVNLHGEGRWRTVAQEAGLNRCAKSCRLRWLNYLRPGIKRGDITEDEEDLIVRLHRLLGNRWALIAGRLPGRTDNEIKNYWNTILVKKLRDGDTALKDNKSHGAGQVIPTLESGSSPGRIKDRIQSENFSCPIFIEDSGSSFLTSIEAGDDLLPEAWGSDSRIFFGEGLNGEARVDGVIPSSSPHGSSSSRAEVNLHTGMEFCEEEKIALNVDLKKLATFLDLDDEWRIS